MFGNPIVSLLAQGALLDWRPLPLAVSALVAAAVYVAIAFAIRKRDDLRLLRDTWAVLAVAFATVAVPLALSASVTACVFALEGAGLVWLGFRQQRRLPRWSGVFLQLASGVAWMLAMLFRHHYDDTPLLNAPFIGALLLVLGAGVATWQYDHHGASKGLGSLTRIGLLAWALAWWFAAWGNEFTAFLNADDVNWAAWFALVAVSGMALGMLGRRARKLDLGMVLAWAMPVSLTVTLGLLQYPAYQGFQVFGGWPLAAVIAAAVAGWIGMAAIGPHRGAAVVASLAWWARWLALLAVGTYDAVHAQQAVGDGWVMLAYVAPTLLLATLSLWWTRPVVAPLAEHGEVIRRLVGLGALALGVLEGIVVAVSAGSARPLPFIPVLNPLDLMLLAVFGLLIRALYAEGFLAAWRQSRGAILAATVFLIATSTTLRAVHHLGGVPWDESMPRSSLAELSLTVVWSAIGVAAWVLGSRRGQRMLWLAGAVCMGIVLAKLLLVDRGHLGNLFGIGSFIAYGLLCTVIGYVAPAPPRQSSQPPSAPPPSESTHAS